MKWIDTYPQVVNIWNKKAFSIQEWRKYAAAIAPDLPEKIEKDSLSYDFQKDVLPVIQTALRCPEKLTMVHQSFQFVRMRIEERFQALFGKEIEVDIVLYLGLCNSAGWATNIGNKDVILLGIEKIIELDWYTQNKMFALVAHELGHIYHKKMGGNFEQRPLSKQNAIFQLYSEGIAMYFEQQLYGENQFYHQNEDGWLDWCESNLDALKAEYRTRIDRGLSINDFFGDWTSYRGHSDTGYYLGCEFVRFMLQKYDFCELLTLSDQILEQEFILFSSFNGLN